MTLGVQRVVYMRNMLFTWLAMVPVSVVGQASGSTAADLQAALALVRLREDTKARIPWNPSVGWLSDDDLKKDLKNMVNYGYKIGVTQEYEAESADKKNPNSATQILEKFRGWANDAAAAVSMPAEGSLEEELKALLDGPQKGWGDNTVEDNSISGVEQAMEHGAADVSAKESLLDADIESLYRGSGVTSLDSEENGGPKKRKRRSGQEPEDTRSLRTTIKDGSQQIKGDAATAQNAITYVMNNDMSTSQNAVESMTSDITTGVDSLSKRLQEWVARNLDDLDELEERRASQYGAVDDGMARITEKQSLFDRDAQDASRVFTKQAMLFDKKVKQEGRERDKMARKVLADGIRNQMSTQRALLKTVGNMYKDDKAAYQETSKTGAKELRKAASGYQLEYRKQMADWKDATRSATKDLTEKKQSIDRALSRGLRLNEAVADLKGADNAGMLAASQEAQTLGQSFSATGTIAQEIKGERHKATSDFRDLEREITKAAKLKVVMAGKQAKADYITKTDETLKAAQTSVAKGVNSVGEYWSDFLKLSEDEQKAPSDVTATEKQLKLINEQTEAQLIGARANGMARQAELKKFVEAEKKAVSDAVTKEDEASRGIGTEIRDRAVAFRTQMATAAEDQKKKFKDIRDGISNELRLSQTAVRDQERVVSGAEQKLGQLEYAMGGLQNSTLPTAMKTIDNANGEIDAGVVTLEHEVDAKVRDSIIAVQGKVQEVEKGAAAKWGTYAEDVDKGIEKLRRDSATALTSGQEELSTLTTDADDEQAKLQLHQQSLEDKMADVDKKLVTEKQYGLTEAQKLASYVKNSVAAGKSQAAEVIDNLNKLQPDVLKVANEGMEEQMKVLQHWTDETDKTTGMNLAAVQRYSQTSLEKSRGIIFDSMKSASEKIDRFDRYFDDVKTKATAQALASSSLAQELYSSLSSTQHHLQAGNIAMVEDKERQAKLLAERAESVRNGIEAKAKRLDTASADLMREEAAKSEAKVKELMSQEGVSKEKLQKLLAEEEDRLQKKMKSIEVRSQTAVAEVDEMGKDQTANAKEMSESISGTDADVKTTDTAADMARLAAKGEENTQLRSDLTGAQQAVEFLDGIKAGVKGMLRGHEDGWKQRVQLATKEVSQGSAKEMKVAVDGLKEFTGDVQADGTALITKLNSQQERLDETSKDLIGRANAANTEFQTRLAQERNATNASVNTITVEAEKGLGRLLNFSEYMTDELEKTGGKVNAKVVAFNVWEERMRKSLEGVLNITKVEDEGLAKGLVEKAHQLLSQHHSLETWLAGFSAHDIGFKRLVYEKMKDLGYEIDMDAVEANTAKPLIKNAEEKLDDQLSGALRGEQARLSADLAAVYAASDQRVADVMRDMSLSEEERRAKCAEIEAEARDKARALFAEQQQMRAREAQLEAQLARYSTLVSEAEGKAQQAIANGHLSPEALGVTKKLGEVNVALARMKAHPLFSALQVESDEERAKALEHLQTENAGLAKEDAMMEHAIAQLEEKLGVGPASMIESDDDTTTQEE